MELDEIELKKKIAWELDDYIDILLNSRPDKSNSYLIFDQISFCWKYENRRPVLNTEWPYLVDVLWSAYSHNHSEIPSFPAHWNWQTRAKEYFQIKSKISSTTNV